MKIKNIPIALWRYTARPFLIFLAAYFVANLFWAGANYALVDYPNFAGSEPAKCAEQRGPMPLSERGWFFEKFFKFFRARIPNESKAGTAFTPGFSLIHWLLYQHTGWTVYTKEKEHGYIPKRCSPLDNPQLVERGSCICITGKTVELEISEGDGDINIYIEPDEHLQYLVQVPDMPAKETRKIVGEIDEWLRGPPDRPNFPILRDLAVGDIIEMCGSHVTDRAHDVHKEIHPISHLRILNEYNCQ